MNAVAAEKKGGFSGTVGSHKSDFFAAADLQGKTVQGMCFFIVIGEVQILRFQ